MCVQNFMSVHPVVAEIFLNQSGGRCHGASMAKNINHAVELPGADIVGNK